MMRNVLNDEKLMAYHERWFERLKDLFDGKNTAPMKLMGALGPRSFFRTINGTIVI